MNGQAGFAHPSASYPYYRDHRAADGAAGYSDTLASAGPAKTLDSLYHSAAKHPEQDKTHASSASQWGCTLPRESRHDGAQDAFMQLIAQQFGGDGFHLNSRMQTGYSSNREAVAQRGASLVYTSESFSSSSTSQPPHSSQRGSTLAEQPLSLTLEEIFHGGMKHVECTRTIVDGVSGYDMPVTELLHVRITPGIREGTRVVLKEQGDEHLGRRSSDVALVVREELHPQFERKGNDLLTRVEVPLVQALTSNYVQVPLLDGDTMEVAVQGPLNPDSEVVLPGMGMPMPEDPAQAGDLHVRFKISFPERVTSAQKAQLQAALS